MPQPDTVPGKPRPNPQPSTIMWEAAPHDERFSASPTLGFLAPPNDAPPSVLQTATCQTPPPEGETDSNLPTINGYRILGVIGRGGMGTVYKALHLELNRIVALKIVHPGGRDDATLRQRFEREFRSLASIEHPNIVPVFDAGNWQGFPYFTMKYIPSGALSLHLDRFRTDPEAGCRLVAKVARAVHRLHEAGVLHRDLKPLNILIGDNDEPLVADFGLAKWVDDDSDVTATGLPMGTRQYMSPEQSLGRKLEYTRACDIWALGIILYEVIAGQRPFASDDPVELYTQIRSGEPPAMAAFDPAAPPALEAVARRCLAKRPDERYPTAEAVAEDLDRWLAGDAVTATLMPTRRPRRRRWAGVLASCAAVALIAVLIGMSAGDDLDPNNPVQPGPPPTPLKPTIAERLTEGETVTLVGEKGLPLEEFAVPPDCTGASRKGRDDLLALTSPGLLMVELVRDPVPLPVRIEAEYSFVVANETSSWAGIYSSRKETMGPNGRNDSLVQFVQTSSYQRASATEETITEKLSSALFVRFEPLKHDRWDLNSVQSSITEPIERKPEYRWHKISVVVTPDSISSVWDDKALLPIDAEPAGKQLNDLFKRANPMVPPPFLAPIFGPGIGLTVRNAEAVFRNVRLVPLTTP